MDQITSNLLVFNLQLPYIMVEMVIMVKLVILAEMVIMV